MINLIIWISIVLHHQICYCQKSYVFNFDKDITKGKTLFVHENVFFYGDRENTKSFGENKCKNIIGSLPKTLKTVVQLGPTHVLICGHKTKTVNADDIFCTVIQLSFNHCKERAWKYNINTTTPKTNLLSISSYISSYVDLYFYRSYTEGESILLQYIHDVILFDNEISYTKSNQTELKTNLGYFKLNPIYSGKMGNNIINFVINRNRIEENSNTTSMFLSNILPDFPLTSYNEMLLECQTETSNGKHLFEEAVLAEQIHFSEENNSTTLFIVAESSSGKMALCIYHFTDLLKQITDTNMKCDNGDENVKKLVHIEGDPSPSCVS